MQAWNPSHGCFHMVWNPNISPKVISSRKSAVIDQMRESLLYLKNSLKSQEGVFSNKKAPLTIFKFHLETGKERGYLHADGIIAFDAYERLNLNAIRDHLNNNELGYNLGGHFHVEYVRNSIQTVIDYSGKDGDILIE